MNAEKLEPGPIGRGKNLTGMRFGRLTVEGFAGRIRDPKGLPIKCWSCRCDCGKPIVVRNGALRGNTRSCGCWKHEIMLTLYRTHGHAGKGKNASGIYQSWRGMKGRCLDPNNGAYKWYGGRGITIHQDWMVFENFLRDLGPAWSPGMTLDRKDVNLGYHPGNVRWVPQSMQGRNRTDNIFLTFNGETKLLVEWADLLKIKSNTLHGRIKRNGWSVEKALSTKV